MLLVAIGPEFTVGILVLALLVAVSDVHGRAAVVTVVHPGVPAVDSLLEVDSLDICQGFMHEGVNFLAWHLCHILVLHQVGLWLEEPARSMCCHSNILAERTLSKEGWTHPSTWRSSEDRIRNFSRPMVTLLLGGA